MSKEEMKKSSGQYDNYIDENTTEDEGKYTRTVEKLNKKYDVDVITVAKHIEVLKKNDYMSYNGILKKGYVLRFEEDSELKRIETGSCIIYIQHSGEAGPTLYRDKLNFVIPPKVEVIESKAIISCLSKVYVPKTCHVMEDAFVQRFGYCSPTEIIYYDPDEPLELDSPKENEGVFAKIKKLFK